MMRARYTTRTRFCIQTVREGRTKGVDTPSGMRLRFKNCDVMSPLSKFEPCRQTGDSRSQDRDSLRRPLSYRRTPHLQTVRTAGIQAKRCHAAELQEFATIHVPPGTEAGRT